MTASTSDDGKYIFVANEPCTSNLLLGHIVITASLTRSTAASRDFSSSSVGSKNRQKSTISPCNRTKGDFKFLNLCAVPLGDQSGSSPLLLSFLFLSLFLSSLSFPTFPSLFPANKSRSFLFSSSLSFSSRFFIVIKCCSLSSSSYSSSSTSMKSPPNPVVRSTFKLSTRLFSPPIRVV